jgi:hypothetical protein
MSFTYNKVTLLCGLSKIGEPDPYAGLSFISGISAAYVCVLDGTLLHILCIVTNTWEMKAPPSFSERTGIGTDSCNLRGGWTSETGCTQNYKYGNTDLFMVVCLMILHNTVTYFTFM